MELLKVRSLALGLMREHGLHEWRLTFDRAKTRAGQCRFDRHEISLSGPLMRLQDEVEVRETILHEIAHALAGPSHGHDATWRRIAHSIGSTGQTRLRTDALPKADWVGTCPRGHTIGRHRRPSRPLSCGRCSSSFTAEAILIWTYKGRPVPMTPAYRAAERAARERALVGRGA